MEGSRAFDLSRSIINLHDKGPPIRLPVSRLGPSSNRVPALSPCRGVGSLRCQAAAAAPAGVREKVHRSTSSGSSEDGASSLLPYGVLLEQGPREEMEDEAVVLGNAHNGYVFAGVYDGHAGSAAVYYLRLATVPKPEDNAYLVGILFSVRMQCSSHPVVST
jgi:hypothetical protein